MEEQSQEDIDMDQFLDQLKERMGCEFTIFEGDTRAYTTVVQDVTREDIMTVIKVCRLASETEMPANTKPEMLPLSSRTGT